MLYYVSAVDNTHICSILPLIKISYDFLNAFSIVVFIHCFLYFYFCDVYVVLLTSLCIWTLRATTIKCNSYGMTKHKFPFCQTFAVMKVQTWKTWLYLNACIGSEMLSCLFHILFFLVIVTGCHLPFFIGCQASRALRNMSQCEGKHRKDRERIEPFVENMVNNE